MIIEHTRWFTGPALTKEDIIFLHLRAKDYEIVRMHRYGPGYSDGRMEVELQHRLFPDSGLVFWYNGLNGRLDSIAEIFVNCGGFRQFRRHTELSNGQFDLFARAYGLPDTKRLSA